MELAQKNRIIKRFLKEQSENPKAVELKNEDLTHYTGLYELLDHIEHNNNHLFLFEKMENDPNQWHKLCCIIKYATTFEKGSLPLLKNISLTKAQERIRHTQNAMELLCLYMRDVNTFE